MSSVRPGDQRELAVGQRRRALEHLGGRARAHVLRAVVRCRPGRGRPRTTLRVQPERDRGPDDVAARELVGDLRHAPARRRSRPRPVRPGSPGGSVWYQNHPPPTGAARATARARRRRSATDGGGSSESGAAHPGSGRASGASSSAPVVMASPRLFHAGTPRRPSRPSHASRQSSARPSSRAGSATPGSLRRDRPAARTAPRSSDRPYTRR